MTHRIINNRFLAAEEPAICELCGDLAELRPYGPNREEVCFKCGMKNKDAAESGFDSLIGLASLPSRSKDRP